jgi:hypothetical protein
LGDYVFAIDGLGELTGDLVFEIDRLMTGRKLTLAVVETASHGMLAAKCVGSEWLLSTIYEQSTARLGRDPITGAGAENLMATAKAIAVDLQKSSGANYVLVQLYAGDNDTLNNKDKSIVIYNTLLAGDSFHQATHSIAGPIKRKQNQAALMALDLLRRYLQDKSIRY